MRLVNSQLEQFKKQTFRIFDELDKITGLAIVRIHISFLKIGHNGMMRYAKIKLSFKRIYMLNPLNRRPSNSTSDNNLDIPCGWNNWVPVDYWKSLKIILKYPLRSSYEAIDYSNFFPGKPGLAHGQWRSKKIKQHSSHASIYKRNVLTIQTF